MKQQQLEQAQARIARMREDFSGLINESSGVYGLHLNGEFAPWNDLLSGGRFEEWLSSIDESAAQSTADIEARAVEKAFLAGFKYANSGDHIDEV